MSRAERRSMAPAGFQAVAQGAAARDATGIDAGVRPQFGRGEVEGARRGRDAERVDAVAEEAAGVAGDEVRAGRDRPGQRDDTAAARPSAAGAG